MDELIESIVAAQLSAQLLPILRKLEKLQPVSSPWLTVSEAAERLKSSPTTVRKMIDHGELKAYQRVSGGLIRIRVEDLDGVLV